MTNRYKEIEHLVQAAFAGRQAFKNDLARRDNPYPAGTNIHEQWDTSFCEALHESIANPTFWAKTNYN